MDLKELCRRDVIRLSSLGAVGLMISPGRAFAQTKPLFRLDEQNSIHFLAGHFIPQFLTLPVEWEVKQFATSGQGRVSAFARGAIDCITTSWTYLAQMAFNDLPGTCVTGMAGGGSRVLVPRGSSIKTWEDLRGKSVGVVEYSFQDISFIYALKKKGIDPSSSGEQFRKKYSKTETRAPNAGSTKPTVQPASLPRGTQTVGNMDVEPPHHKGRNLKPTRLSCQNGVWRCRDKGRKGNDSRISLRGILRSLPLFRPPNRAKSQNRD